MVAAPRTAADHRDPRAGDVLAGPGCSAYRRRFDAHAIGMCHAITFDGACARQVRRRRRARLRADEPLRRGDDRSPAVDRRGSSTSTEPQPVIEYRRRHPSAGAVAGSRSRRPPTRGRSTSSAPRRRGAGASSPGSSRCSTRSASARSRSRSAATASRGRRRSSTPSRRSARSAGALRVAAGDRWRARPLRHGPGRTPRAGATSSWSPAASASRRCASSILPRWPSGGASGG